MNSYLKWNIFLLAAADPFLSLLMHFILPGKPLSPLLISVTLLPVLL